MQKEIEKQQKKEKEERENAPLNFIGALRDDPERQRFVIKTYSILTVQLAFTTMACAYVNSNEDAKLWIRDNIWLYYVSLVFGIAILCTLLCCIKHAKKVPRNYILLSIFTVCWTYMVAAFTQYFDSEDVLIAAGITLSMVIGLTLFACFTKMKLTWLWGIGAALSLAIWPLIIFSWIFPSKMLYNVICFLVVILTSIYIIHDTKLIMKKLELDEYIIGALLLYVDIIQLFMFILSLMGNN